MNSEIDNAFEVMNRRIAALVGMPQEMLRPEGPNYGAGLAAEFVQGEMIKRKIAELSDDRLVPVLGIISAMAFHTPRKPRSKKKRALKKWRKKCSAAWADPKNRELPRLKMRWTR